MYVNLHLKLIALLASNTKCSVCIFFLLVSFLYCDSDKNEFLTKKVLQTYNLLRVFSPRFQVIQFAVLIMN